MRTEPSFSADPENFNDVSSSESNINFSDEHHTDTQLLSDYRQRYGLSVDPFADDPHFPLYTGALRRQILDQLLHLSQFSNNLLVVLGDYGVGKTRMAQALIDSLDDADDICFLEGQITSTFDSLFKNVIEQFELSDVEEFKEFTCRQTENDGLAILIVDNAHHLPDIVLAELIGLLQYGEESRIHLVLFAEPHLLPRLEHLDIPDIVLSDFQLEKFSLTESVDYLNFRMEMADYLGPEIFTESTVEAWWRQSRGELLRLHESAQDKLLASVSASQSLVNNKKSPAAFYIVIASALGAALLMSYLYWGESEPAQLPGDVGAPTALGIESPGVAPASSQLEPILLREGDNAVQALYADSSAKTIVSESVSSVSPVASVASQNVSIPVEDKASKIPIVKQDVVPLVQVNTAQQDTSGLARPVVTTKEIKKLEAPQVAAKSFAKTVKSQPEKIKTTTGGYSEQEKNILSWKESEFTLQVMGLSSENAARDYVAAQSNKKDLLVFKSLRQGKDWFVVIVGRYPSSVTARAAVQSLPEGQRKAAPWPRDLRTIKNEIKRRQE
ncbi:MAG: AAA family ATPase [Pseudomonadota bacterium]